MVITFLSLNNNGDAVVDDSGDAVVGNSGNAVIKP